MQYARDFQKLSIEKFLMAKNVRIYVNEVNLPLCNSLEYSKYLLRLKYQYLISVNLKTEMS